jgi:hypothetical protein
MDLIPLATALLEIQPDLKLNKDKTSVVKDGRVFGVSTLKDWFRELPKDLRRTVDLEDGQEVHEFRNALYAILLERKQNISMDPDLESITIGLDLMKKQYYIIDEGCLQKDDFESWKVGVDEDQLGLLMSNIEKMIPAFHPDKPSSWVETINTTKGPKDYKMYNRYIPPYWKQNKEPKDFSDIGPKLLMFFETFIPDKEERDWTIYWLYTLMTRRCEYILTLRGIQGSGKTLLAQLIMIIAGEENSSLAGLRFGTDKFNSEISNKKFVFLDEFKMKEVQRETFKNISNDKIIIEGKGLDPITAKNHCSYCIATNYRKYIILEHNDRRFFVPKLCEKKIDTVIDQKVLDFLWDNSRPDNAGYREFCVKFPMWVKHYVESNNIKKDFRFPLKTQEFYDICETHKPKWFHTFKEQLQSKGIVTYKSIYSQTKVKVSDVTIQERIEIETDERRQRGLNENWVKFEFSESQNLVEYTPYEEEN